MVQAQILTWWVGAGTPADPYVPHVAESFALHGWHDATDQPELLPSPNAVVVNVRCSAEVLAAIEADPEYDGAVLWSEEVPDAA